MRKVVLLLACSLIFIAGCGSVESKIVGTWKPQSMKDSKVIFNADHTYAIHGMVEFTGKWSLNKDEDTITLNADTIEGIPKDKVEKEKGPIKPIQVKVSEDVKTLNLLGAELHKGN